MNTRPKSKRRMTAVIVLMAVMMMVSIIPVATVNAAVPYPETGTFVIHKLAFDDSVPESERVIRGNGLAMNDLPTNTGVEGAKFNIITVQSSDTLSMTPTQEEAAAFYGAKNGTAGYTSTTATTGSDGSVVTNSLPAGTYLIYEDPSTNLEETLSAPVVVSVPIMNQEGTAWVNQVHLYMKSTFTLCAAQLYKNDGEAGYNTPLPGALFDLYRVGNGNEEHSEGNDERIAQGLITGDDGLTPVVQHLTAGTYYFVETRAPGAYLADYTKHTFTLSIPENSAYNQNGELIPASIYKVGTAEKPVANYKAPTIDKAVDSPTADYGEHNLWTLTVKMPTNVGAYKTLNISDTLDTRLDFIDDSVKIYTDAALTTQLNPAAYNVTYNSVGEHEHGERTVYIRFNLITGINYLVNVPHLYITYETNINKNEDPADAVPNTAYINYHNNSVYDSLASFHTPTVVSGGQRFYKINPTSQPLANAKFRIYRMNEGVKEYALQDPATGFIKWTPLSAITNISTQASSYVSDREGLFQVKGLAYGEYYIEEYQAPTGYNLLKKDEKFTIDAGSYKVEHKITVVNTSAPIIPVTGGIGTIIFYASGALLIGFGILVLLKQKKKEKTHSTAESK